MKILKEITFGGISLFLIISLILILWWKGLTKQAKAEDKRIPSKYDFTCKKFDIPNRISGLYRCENSEAICHIFQAGISCWKK